MSDNSSSDTRPLNLSEGLADQILRNQKLLEHYREVSKMPGVYTGFAEASIKNDIKLGIEAQGSGDIVKMAQAYQRLQENE